jgi:hypothetical protein
VRIARPRVIISHRRRVVPVIVVETVSHPSWRFVIPPGRPHDHRSILPIIINHHRISDFDILVEPAREGPLDEPPNHSPRRLSFLSLSTGHNWRPENG